MKTIEFVGPSGIGKTTFLNSLMEQRAGPEWLTREEGKRVLSRKEGKLFKKAFSRIIGYFGFSIKKDGRSFYFLEELKRNETECADLIELFYESLLSEDMAGWQKIRLHNYYMRGILYQIILLNDLPDDTLLVLDEGIVQNGGVGTVLDSFEKYKDIKNSSIFPNGIIYFNSSMDQYRIRLNARFNKRGDRAINSILTDVGEYELEDIMIKSKQESLKKVEACRVLGIPVLEIESDNSQDEFVKALNFIDRFKV